MVTSTQKLREDIKRYFLPTIVRGLFALLIIGLVLYVGSQYEELFSGAL